MKHINPALSIRNFYSFSMTVLDQINFARMHPEEYVEKLEDLKESVEKAENKSYLVIQKVPFLYNNLEKSLEDAIKFLKEQEPLDGLKFNKEITKGCDYLLDTLIIHDGIKDEFADKYSLEVRLNKYGVPMGEIYELIDYGMFDPEFIVINFILSDGDDSKYERNVLFNPKLTSIGIASALLPSDKICTVINFAEAFYRFDEDVSFEDKQKFAKKTPVYGTKTINNYAGLTDGEAFHVGKVTSNTRSGLNEVEQKISEVQTKKQKSGDVFKMKRTQYVRRSGEGEVNENLDPVREEHEEREEIEEIYGGIDPKIPLRRRRTIHEPKILDEIPLDFENEFNFFDKEFDLHSPNFSPSPESSKKKKKKTTTTTQEEDFGGGFKKVTTTVTEEVIEHENGVETKHVRKHDKKVREEPGEVGEEYEFERQGDKEKNDRFGKYGGNYSRGYGEGKFREFGERGEIEGREWDKEFQETDSFDDIKEPPEIREKIIVIPKEETNKTTYSNNKTQNSKYTNSTYSSTQKDNILYTGPNTRKKIEENKYKQSTYNSGGYNINTNSSYNNDDIKYKKVNKVEVNNSKKSASKTNNNADISNNDITNTIADKSTCSKYGINTKDSEKKYNEIS